MSVRKVLTISFTESGRLSADPRTVDECMQEFTNLVCQALDPIFEDWTIQDGTIALNYFLDNNIPNFKP